MSWMPNKQDDAEPSSGDEGCVPDVLALCRSFVLLACAGTCSEQALTRRPWIHGPGTSM